VGKVLFLFGAGASKGAGHIDPTDPPSGADVYDRLAWECPSVWGAGSQLGRKVNSRCIECVRPGLSSLVRSRFDTSRRWRHEH
jgi:hypothetical protein